MFKNLSAMQVVKEVFRIIFYGFYLYATAWLVSRYEGPFMFTLPLYLTFIIVFGQAIQTAYKDLDERVAMFRRVSIGLVTVVFMFINFL